MEEIIIDGVDVSECIHFGEWSHCDICKGLIKTKKDRYGKPRNHLLTEEDLRCDFYNDCYYKQLKRKEKECEELGKWKEDVADKFMRTCNCKYLDNKRTYCEYYKAECVAINQCLYANQDKVEKLKQALQKITEYCCENIIVEPDLMTDILNIISEVEE